jgi:hypothetical protein
MAGDLAGDPGMENESSPLHVRILVFEDLPGIWTARSLEHDIVAESRTIEMAIQAVVRIMRAHADFDRRHNRAPLTTFRAAPQMYWNAYRQGTPLAWASRLGLAFPGLTAQVSVAVATERPHGRVVRRERAPMTPWAQAAAARL